MSIKSLLEPGNTRDTPPCRITVSPPDLIETSDTTQDTSGSLVSPLLTQRSHGINMLFADTRPGDFDLETPTDVSVCEYYERTFSWQTFWQGTWRWENYDAACLNCLAKERSGAAEIHRINCCSLRNMRAAGRRSVMYKLREILRHANMICADSIAIETMLRFLDAHPV